MEFCFVNREKITGLELEELFNQINENNHEKNGGVGEKFRLNETNNWMAKFHSIFVFEEKKYIRFRDVEKHDHQFCTIKQGDKRAIWQKNGNYNNPNKNGGGCAFGLLEDNLNIVNKIFNIDWSIHEIQKIGDNYYKFCPKTKKLQPHYPKPKGIDKYKHWKHHLKDEDMVNINLPVHVLKEFFKGDLDELFLEKMDK